MFVSIGDVLCLRDLVPFECVVAFEALSSSRKLMLVDAFALVADLRPPKDF